MKNKSNDGASSEAQKKRMKRILSFFIAVCCFLTASIFCFLPDMIFHAEEITDTSLSKQFPKGDTDEDGKITVKDARTLLRVAVGLETVPDGKLAQWDIKENGRIDIADARAALRVAVGLPMDSSPRPAKPSMRDFSLRMANKVKDENLKSSMKMLCSDIGTRYVGSKNETLAGEALNKKLHEMGLSPVLQHVSVGNKKMPSNNLVITFPTKKSNPDIYLFCTHYDCSHLSVGAVDNASGVAALLELARILKETNTDFGCEIRIAFFTGEENGYYGAYKYRSSLSDSERNRHMIFFNVDMAGHSTDGNKNYLCVSTEPVAPTYSQTKKTAYDNIGSKAVRQACDYIGICGADGFYSPVAAGMHDIIPFRKAGFPSLTLSWRERDSYRGAGNDYNLATPAVIHTSADNLSNFDSSSLYRTTQLISASFAILVYGYIY